jgi:hypothetical protein
MGGARSQSTTWGVMILALRYPIVLGLDRLEAASLLRSNRTLQYLTGMPSFPDPQTLRRFILQAPPSLLEQLRRVNDRLVQHFIHLPSPRSRLIFDFNSMVLTVFGHQEKASVGYNPHYRGKRSYHPLLSMEANSSEGGGKFCPDAPLARGPCALRCEPLPTMGSFFMRCKLSLIQEFCVHGR